MTDEEAAVEQPKQVYREPTVTILSVEDTEFDVVNPGADAYTMNS